MKGRLETGVCSPEKQGEARIKKTGSWSEEQAQKQGFFTSSIKNRSKKLVFVQRFLPVSMSFDGFDSFFLRQRHKPTCFDRPQLF